MKAMHEQFTWALWRIVHACPQTQMRHHNAEIMTYLPFLLLTLMDVIHTAQGDGRCC